ncbi:MAG TPA: hypothetical protein VF712_03515 [Thermoleophilaceae bacterium]|jgi:hypothetical protein
MRQKLLAPVTLAVLLLAAPAVARADGLPAGTNADPGGITTPSSDANFFVAPAGRGTIVGRVAKRGGRLADSVYLDRPFAMPAVAFDGTPGGLSAGGGTLVLIRPRARFPQRSTVLAVVDGQHLYMRKTVRLRGDFSFDALSPDGRRLYLIQYLSRRDPTRYAVRSYDLRAERLDPGPIVDAREPDEDMSGLPLTRATSAHGRWAYTLYDGGEHRFVHALDTVRRRAFCIDLPAISNDDLLNVRLDLAAGGRSLAVTRRGARLALIDTRTFEVSRPARPRSAARASGGDPGPPWGLIGIGLAAALLAAAAALAARRRNRIPARA